MARGKKKEENLTLEEKLEQALVPEEEWPYEVPGNWCWIKLPMAFSNRTSSRNKIKQKDYLCRGRFAIVDQGENLIGGFTNDENMLYNGPLPVIIFGDHTRRLKYIDFVFVQGADGVKVLQPRKFYHAKAFYYAIQNVEILNMGYRRHFPLFDKFKIPLPPLNEQKRIIDYIEGLFLKLDETKEKVQYALESSEDRKAAILRTAFSGELTKQWREKNGIGKESWKILRLGTKLEKIITGKSIRCEERCPENNEVGIIKVSAVTWGEFNESESKTCLSASLLNKAYLIQEGDFLFSRANTIKLVGACVLVKKINKPLMLSDKILRFHL